MKWIVGLLLLANVALFAYFNLSQATSNGAHIGLQPIHPEQVKLLTAKDIEAMPKKDATGDSTVQAAPAALVQTACYEWGSFSAGNLPKARNVLFKFSLQAITKQQTTKESARYWIYIPRAKSLQAAQDKMEELRNLGIDDIFIVQEPQWRYAISLGVYKDEQLATKRLEDLQTRGVRSAVKALRNQEQGQASLVINSMAPDMVAEIEKLKPDFPGSEIKQVSCQ
ncbi:MAG TPA: hypothetical protein VK974_00960 [Methylophilaceae bacterium]|nr:hypothetical protein [Methylophilaceae bacterium]